MDILINIGIFVVCILVLSGWVAFMRSPTLSIDTLLPKKFCKHRIVNRYVYLDGRSELVCLNCDHTTDV